MVTISVRTNECYGHTSLKHNAFNVVVSGGQDIKIDGFYLATVYTGD